MIDAKEFTTSTKIVKVLFTYKEFGKHSRSLQYDKKKAKEIIKWIGRDYLRDLIDKDNLWK